MKKETIETFVRQLDGMIAALQQSVVIGGQMKKEREACELLKDARLKLIEEQDSQGTIERCTQCGKVKSFTGHYRSPLVDGLTYASEWCSCKA